MSSTGEGKGRGGEGKKKKKEEKNLPTNSFSLRSSLLYFQLFDYATEDARQRPSTNCYSKQRIGRFFPVLLPAFLLASSPTPLETRGAVVGGTARSNDRAERGAARRNSETVKGITSTVHEQHLVMQRNGISRME